MFQVIKMVKLAINEASNPDNRANIKQYALLLSKLKGQGFNGLNRLRNSDHYDFTTPQNGVGAQEKTF